MPLNPYPTGDQIGAPDEGLESSVPKVKFLAPVRRELYYGMGSIRTPDADSLTETKRCLIFNNGIGDQTMPYR